MGVLTLTRRDFSRRGATLLTQTRCYFGHSIGVLSFVAQLRYVDKKNVLSILGPRRFTNVFDESKINRIRIFAMFWTEYGDSFLTTNPRTTVIQLPA